MRVRKNSTPTLRTTRASTTRPMILASFFMITPVIPCDLETLKLVQRCCHLFGQRQARGQPRRLDAEQADETSNAVDVRPVNQKVRRRFTRPAELGPHAGITRLQALAAAVGPITPYRPGESIGQPGVDLVIQRRRVTNIRAEAQLALQVQSGMDAQPGGARLRHGIDQMPERRAPGIAVIAPLARIQRRYRSSRIALHSAGQLLGKQPSGIDQIAATDAETLPCADAVHAQ